MHVVVISDTEMLGGAAIAAARLAVALQNAGHQVTRVVGAPDDQPHEWPRRILTHPKPALADRIARRMLNSGEPEAWDRRRAAEQLSHLLRELEPDAISLHNVHFMRWAGWSWEMARAAAEIAPTFWTLHDMWSFTGRCAYAYDCQKFIQGCDASCPTPDESPALPARHIAAHWQARQRMLQAPSDLTAIAPSRWMAAQARAGLWRDRPIEVVPNGLPLDTFAPRERAAARAALNIPNDRPVLLIAAQSWDERRKGGAFLVEALKSIDRPLSLMILGGGQLPPLPQNIQAYPLGYVSDDQVKVNAYSAADVLVHPAPVDNLPNVVMEAMACGTPTIGYNVCGVPELVRPGKTGWLASALAGDALRISIQQALAAIRDGIDLRASCRAVAEAEYSDHIQATRYLELFARSSALARISP